ncbi:MAG: gamma-glutamyltransferase [Acidobacteria bacterium]|nr:gamma-glutamyltransferase [Acidobacteriota bacterium]
MRFVRLLSIVALACAPAAQAATREPVHARKAMVAATEPHAARAGLETLRDGGNAVDAAVAVGLALAVTHPSAGNLGGGGFMLIRFPDGRSTFLDFRETAPAAASRDMYLDAAGKATDRSLVGYQASGVPGSARGFELARRKYGSLPWKRLIAPAQELAHKGFPLPWGMAQALRGSERLARFPESRRIFQNGGRFFEYGDRFVQPDLAATLDRMAKKGADEFYQGETARRIAADMARNGGSITLADLAAYEPKERRPLEGTYRGYDILSAPPASSGGAGVIQMLNMLEPTRYFEAGAGSAQAIHHVAEAMRRFFADRAEFFGDTDFAKDVPLRKLISKDYAQARAATIDPRRATPSAQVSAGPALGPESEQTTHYSVVDEQGMAVAVTYTLNGGFGSGVTAAGTGVLLNNEMDDFTSKPGSPNQFGLLQSERNAIEPGKRPLSAMTPTIVSKDGKLFLVVGSPGGPTIISTVLQTILNVIDFRMDLQRAVDFPRFHHQWMPDELRMESWGFSPDTLHLLEGMGHKLAPGGEMGRTMAIQVVEDGLVGAADSRSAGLATGY